MSRSLAALCVWVGLSLTVAVAAEGDPPREAGKDKAQPQSSPLDGLWRGFVVEGKGEQPDRGPVHLELVIKGNHITARQLRGKAGEDLGEGTYAITRGKPSTIDATKLLPRGRTQTYLGICELQGDTFRRCTATPNKERPTEFASEGRGRFLLVLKRQKP